MTTSPFKDTLLKTPQVIEVTGLSRATIWRWVSTGGFPQPVRLGTRSVAWRQSDIQNWISALNNSAAIIGK